MAAAPEAGPQAGQWTPARYARNGAADIAYDTLAGSRGEPLLLVMGLGVARFWWPAGLCQELAARGFAVARYDQRDAGQSTRMPDTAGSNPFVALVRKRAGYTSEDMTDDAIAVLDALGWERAHVFGASLGAVIAQRIALRHPGRVLSVTSVAGLPSDVSGLGAARYVRFGLLARLARAKVPEGREGDIQLSMMLARGVASPAYPFDEEAARAWIERDVDTGPRDTKAQSRQVGAAWHGPRLRELRQPALVLHGDRDPILRASAARATARAIEGARLVVYPGMGHDLPAPLWAAIAGEVRQLADRVPRPSGQAAS
ncbi:MAG TPA: alpha/beta hydrolase [Trebonia sp.]|jgi:pimeloyl-ACP methyl ester carboxylesterase|nr:alpha/beta hydrolase [Trebonia sp.]